jgi:hypothetical protein
MVHEEMDHPQTQAELDAVTHRLARHVVAGHSESAEECAYFLTMLGLNEHETTPRTT